METKVWKQNKPALLFYGVVKETLHAGDLLPNVTLKCLNLFCLETPNLLKLLLCLRYGTNFLEVINSWCGKTEKKERKRKKTESC